MSSQAFIDAGVPHVVAVRVDTRVSDMAARTFTRAFYLSLFVGNTLQAAYDIGVQAVVSAPDVPGGGELEANKFLLLPARESHLVSPFKSLAGVEQWEPPPRLTAGQHTLPALVEVSAPSGLPAPGMPKLGLPPCHLNPNSGLRGTQR